MRAQTFQTHTPRVCSALLHGGSGAVGNYRSDKDAGLEWLFTGYAADHRAPPFLLAAPT